MGSIHNADSRRVTEGLEKIRTEKGGDKISRLVD